MATVRVSSDTLKALVEYAGKLQIQKGSVVSMDDAIRELLTQAN
jgi:hypothetical protein